MPDKLTTIIYAFPHKIHLKEAEVVMYAIYEDGAIWLQLFYAQVQPLAAPVIPFVQVMPDLAFRPEVLSYVIRRICYY